MERTESKVIQVAPAHENSMIKLMETFGWSLQGRQEIHEEGNTEGHPSLLGDEYIIKTKVSHYVKLHFNRSLRMPNLEKIRGLEHEYFGLDVSMPSLFPGGWIWLGFYPFWPLYYFFYYKRKKLIADARREEVARRGGEILREIAALLQ